MGYDTRFEGHFVLSRKLGHKQACWLRELMEGRLPDDKWASCDWELNDDDKTIGFNGSEKFYEYVPWMQYITDSLKQKFGIEVSGEVNYSGEDFEDHGILKIVDGKVLQIQDSEVLSSLEEENKQLKAEVEHFKMLITELNEQRVKMLNQQS